MHQLEADAEPFHRLMAPIASVRLDDLGLGELRGHLRVDVVPGAPVSDSSVSASVQASAARSRSV